MKHFQARSVADVGCEMFFFLPKPNIEEYMAPSPALWNIRENEMKSEKRYVCRFPLSHKANVSTLRNPSF